MKEFYDSLHDPCGEKSDHRTSLLGCMATMGMFIVFALLLILLITLSGCASAQGAAHIPERPEACYHDIHNAHTHTRP